VASVPAYAVVKTHTDDCTYSWDEPLLFYFAEETAKKKAEELNLEEYRAQWALIKSSSLPGIRRGEEPCAFVRRRDIKKAEIASDAMKIVETPAEFCGAHRVDRIEIQSN
jgi:hypothetical protein